MKEVLDYYPGGNEMVGSEWWDECDNDDDYRMLMKISQGGGMNPVDKMIQLEREVQELQDRYDSAAEDLEWAKSSLEDQKRLVANLQREMKDLKRMLDRI